MKAKFEQKQITEVIGMLDYDDNGELIIVVEDDTYSLKDILDSKGGYEIQLKLIYQ